MCGIVGKWSNQDLTEGHFENLAERMLSAVTHRGPDDGGYAVDDRVFLGNRRLKIFDLSDAGNQPMFSEDGSVWLVFNGEIYNHYELRNELAGDYNFRSSSDTEVLLRAYEKWGIDCLEHLNGMFAFAVLDRRKGKLLLCRDRLGIKPLYYWTNGHSVVFASEIKALLAAGIEASPDHGVLKDYLVNGNYDHTERTFFKNVSRVRAGHYLEVTSGGIRDVCYWNPYERIARDDPKAEQEYWATLEDAVRLRMRSDVPYAVMLSGGLDSSTLADFADRHVGAHALNVCTFRHREFKYDEGPWADLVSRGRGWNAHSVVMTEEAVQELLFPALWHQEEPFGSVATFADIRLAELARSHGIYVLLEGQGADETLGGYEYYYLYYLADLAQRDRLAALGLYGEYAVRRNLDPENPDTSFDTILKRGGERNSGLSQDGTTPIHVSAISNELYAQQGTGFQEPEISDKRFENVMFRDLFYTKVPRVLRFKDKASMMHGVELRVPFLDHRLVELSFSIDASSKLNGGHTKALLRQYMKGRLPEETCLHVKRQVQTPQREWLRGLLRPLVEDVIHSGSFGDRGFFDVDTVRRTYSDYVEHPERYSNSFFIWQWVLTEWWLRIFVDGLYSPPRITWVNPVNERRMPASIARRA